MDKEQAINAMRNGKKITHVYFLREEYVYMRNGKIFDENHIEHKEFFQLRQDDHWNTGWMIYDEQLIK